MIEIWDNFQLYKNLNVSIEIKLIKTYALIYIYNNNNY